MITESDLEHACLSWFAELGYEVLDPDHLDPESVYDERSSRGDVILQPRLIAAMERLNPEAPPEALDEGLRRLLRHDAPTLEQNNYDFHRLLTEGITVEVAGPQGVIRGVRLKIVDTADIESNDFVVCNQVRVVDRTNGTGQERIPDVVVWINGLPIAVIELKNPRSEQADIWGAYNQLQTYKRDIPSLFRTNELLVVSDDVLTRVGSLTAGPSRFQPWRAVQHEKDVRVPAESSAVLDRGERLQALIEGIFEKERLLDLICNFVTFETQEGRLVKKVAAYHQFHAVRRAVRETERATHGEGDRRVGVVWHTQGSGKSLTMLFYAAQLIRARALQNPTLVVLTDRNDLDDQLFGTFAQAQDLLRQAPVQAESREHLRELLKTASGGVYFTTIQKFLPPDGERAAPLSERRNIVVIADEAHRSQYGLTSRVTKKGEVKYGLATHLRDAIPNASFVGFTGTPVELEDKNTVEVFGEYISIYDIRRAVEDGATVPIYYENRLAKIELDEDERPHIDERFEEITEGEEETVKEKLKSEWSTLEALVGTEKRLSLVAEDLVAHFEKRNQVMAGGKAMIVCMSRRICVAMYEAIRRIRPQWCAEEDDQGKVKVVMTGTASDKQELRDHVRTKAQREALAARFKDPSDGLELVIVRDMWLTGFDAPCLHTMYIDKPMRGHNLMQAIARVNRVFGDKPGGLVVDYLGLATFLKEAMATYTRSGGQGQATSDPEKALEAFQERLEICREVFHGFDYGRFFRGSPAERLDLLPAAREHVLQQRTGSEGSGNQKRLDGYDRFLKTVAELSKLSALVVSTPEFEAAREEVALFQAVKAGLVKLSPGRSRPQTDLGHAVRQIVSNAIVSEEVIDVFSAAGLSRPDISVLSEEFLAEVQALPHKNLAAAVLERILRNELRQRRRESIAQVRSFEEKLEAAVRKYLNRSIEAKDVIEELLAIAREFQALGERAKELGLSREELTFYDVLAQNQSAKEVLGDKMLADMAGELTRLVRENATIDWDRRSAVQAKLRVLVKRLLKKRGYPPDGQQRATEDVLEQARQLKINLTEGASESDGQVGDWTEEGVPRPPSRPPAPMQPLPYPIAIFDALVQSQGSKVLRLKTRMDGIERAVAFLVACELAWLRKEHGGTDTAQVRKVLGSALGKPVSMGTWVNYAIALAKLLPRDSTHPIVRAALALVDENGKPSDLAKRIQDVVPYRNNFAHGVTPSEEQLGEQEPLLHGLWEHLEKALAPLRETALVAVSRLHDVDEGATAWHYEVRRLMGDKDRFPIVQVTVGTKMKAPWVHVLWGEDRPISLWPLVSLMDNEATKLPEVYFSRALQLEPGTRVDAMGVASSSARKIEI